jgi:hypothetical protein
MEVAAGTGVAIGILGGEDLTVGAKLRFMGCEVKMAKDWVNGPFGNNFVCGDKSGNAAGGEFRDTL